MHNNINICFIITGLAYGGAEIQMFRLATRLKARGWEVRVISLTQPTAYIKEFEIAGIPVASLGIKQKFPDPRPILSMIQIIWAWRPKIIHSHMVHANILTRLMQLMAPVPLLINTAHSTDEGGHIRELLYRLTDPLCELTTQVSKAGLERYVEVGAVPRHKIRYIPNGVDTERFHPDPEIRRLLRNELGLGTAFVWLAVGRLDIPKDYPNMLQAFARVSQERLEAVLIIIGDGPLHLEMEELAQSLGLKGRVRFLGIRNNVHELMNIADSYVMSSIWEGMPNVLLEAGAMGHPIVATDVGGNREVVRDGETGILVPPKNPRALAEAMLRLMNFSDKERRQMGEVSRRYIEACYSLDHVVSMWEALYQEMLLRK